MDVRLDIKLGESVRVQVDRTRALQVFSNLVTNAIRFTPEGESIELRSRSLKRWVEFAVADTGVGIPAEELRYIFDRFSQANRTGAGTAGLGLAIARGIVEAHGGQIRAESKPGEGSTFVFTLQRARTEPSGAAQEAAS